MPGRLWAETQPEPSKPAITTPVLRAVRLDPKDPFRMEFIFDSRIGLSEKIVSRTVEYFLAALTIPEQNLWVNLSPYEQDRVMDDNLVKTSFGASLLKEDYFLKQLAASLTNPETEAGGKYWQEINNAGANNHSSAGQAFSKVWIVPDGAQVKENGYAAYIEHSALEVLTEEDFTAVKQNDGVGVIPYNRPDNDGRKHGFAPTANNGIDAFRKHIIPLINKEVNEGGSFVELRQMYNAFILATWFKQKVRDSIFKYYIDNDKTSGIDRADKNIKEKIYAAYLDAFKKGAYNYVKTERVGAIRESPMMVRKITKRHYFSGGVQIDRHGLGFKRNLDLERELCRLAEIGASYGVCWKPLYGDSHRVSQCFYGAQPEKPGSGWMAGNYAVDVDLNKGDALPEIRLVAHGIADIQSGRVYRFRNGGSSVAITIAVQDEKFGWPLDRETLFYVYYSQKAIGIVLRRDTHLSSEEILEVVQMLYWQEYLGHVPWYLNFKHKKYEAIEIALSELYKIKALAEIIKVHGRNGLTPLQKKFLSVLNPARASSVIQDVTACFIDRKNIIAGYLGDDAKILFDYIEHQYLPALRAIAQPGSNTEGGVALSSQNIFINHTSGAVFNLSNAVMANLKRAYGMTFRLESRLRE